MEMAIQTTKVVARELVDIVQAMLVSNKCLPNVSVGWIFTVIGSLKFPL